MFHIFHSSSVVRRQPLSVFHIFRSSSASLSVSHIPAYLVGSDVVENAFPQGTSGLGNGAVGQVVHLQEGRAVDTGRAEVG